MSNIVVNLSRRELLGDLPFWGIPKGSLLLVISEPGTPKITTGELANRVKGKFTKIDEVKFWDLETPSEVFFAPGQFYQPPSREEIKEIYNLLTLAKWNNIYVACMAGKSRSGAIAAFANHKLGYNWSMNKDRATPNKLIYDTLVEIHNNANQV